LQIYKGDICYLFGPSGCGKTTILNLLCGLLKPLSGTVNFSPELEGGRFFSYVMQRSTLLPWFDIRRNIMQEAKFRRLKVCDTEIENLAQLMDLSYHLGKLPVELSGGMRSRAEIMRALCMNPRLLMLDEAFQGIDAQRRKNIMTEIFTRVENSQLSVISCSHQPLEIMMAADRIPILVEENPIVLKEIVIQEPRQKRDEEWYQGSEAKEIRNVLGWGL
jgi:NitT/TauT family transport system ATP-binding protein